MRDATRRAKLHLLLFNRIFKNSNGGFKSIVAPHSLLLTHFHRSAGYVSQRLTDATISHAIKPAVVMKHLGLATSAIALLFRATSTTSFIIQSLRVPLSLSKAVSATSPQLANRDEIQVARDVFEVDARPVILYDGVCNMCNNFVNTLLDIDTDGKFRYSPLQGPTGRALLTRCGRSPDDISRSVACITGSCCQHSA